MARKPKMEFHGDLPIVLLPRRHRAAYYLGKMWKPKEGLTEDEATRLMVTYREHNDTKAEKDASRHAVTTLLRAGGIDHGPGRAGATAGLDSVANFEGAQLEELAPEAKVNGEVVTRVGLSRSTSADLYRPHEVARDALNVFVDTEASDGTRHLWVVSWPNTGRAESYIDGYVREPGLDDRDPDKNPIIIDPVDRPGEVEARFAPMKAEILDLVQTCAANFTQPQPQPTH